jgi:hypothetical protein
LGFEGAVSFPSFEGAVSFPWFEGAVSFPWFEGAVSFPLSSEESLLVPGGSLVGPGLVHMNLTVRVST